MGGMNSQAEEVVMGDKHPMVSFAKHISELILHRGQTVTVRLVGGLAGEVGLPVVLRVSDNGMTEVFLGEDDRTYDHGDWKPLFPGDKSPWPSARA